MPTESTVSLREALEGLVTRCVHCGKYADEHAPLMAWCEAATRFLSVQQVLDKFALAAPAPSSSSSIPPQGRDNHGDRVIKLEEALREAIDAIQLFHGLAGWELYRDHSPEMKRWRAALAAAPGNEGALK
jgi:hypothetical protein